MTDVLTRLSPFLTFDAHALHERGGEVRPLFDLFLDALESGRLRTATPGPDGTWTVEPRVKQAILLGFRLGVLVDMSEGETLSFVDKDTYPARRFTPEGRVRVVPGGSSVRRGAHVAPGVTIMPPAYVNVGAFIDEGTLVDSHALVGSCAQVGKRVHISAAAQVGGVLEPVGALPVIIEDDVLVGGNTGIYEGTIVRTRAVLGAGVVLTASTRVYDLVHERILGGESGLEIPAGAVVVPGSRPARGAFAEKNGLSISTPLIIKYRDAKTDAKAALEEALR
jgi:2,3,4,5-tetrahydropyridine-2-carboxylate N-succinyltransferase